MGGDFTTAFSQLLQTHMRTSYVIYTLNNCHAFNYNSLAWKLNAFHITSSCFTVDSKHLSLGEGYNSDQRFKIE